MGTIEAFNMLRAALLHCGVRPEKTLVVLEDEASFIRVVARLRGEYPFLPTNADPVVGVKIAGIAVVVRGAPTMKAGGTRMKTYIGDLRGNVHVVEDGKPLARLNPRLDLRSHSPSGFSWGYMGSGPAQLALALCADVLQDDKAALRIHQLFKDAFVVGLSPTKEWKAWDYELRPLMMRLLQERERDGA